MLPVSTSRRFSSWLSGVAQRICRVGSGVLVSGEHVPGTLPCTLDVGVFAAGVVPCALGVGVAASGEVTPGVGVVGVAPPGACTWDEAAPVSSS